MTRPDLDRLLERIVPPTRAEVRWLVETVKRYEEALERVNATGHNCLQRTSGTCRIDPLFVNAGTCWWDAKAQRILPQLPKDACVWCVARAALASEGTEDK